MNYLVWEQSRIGGRAVNQDRLLLRATSQALLLVAADGMGGHAHGEVAAQVAVDRLAGAFEREARPRLADPFGFLARGLNDAHAAILRVAGARELAEVPCTTCVACVIQDGLAHWVHAGDARLYLLRDGAVYRRSRDHTKVQLLLDQGLIDAATARRHPERNRVYSCLGGPGVPQIDFSSRTPLLPGDVLALCTDGVWSPAGDEALARLLGGDEPQRAGPRLMDLAEHNGGGHGDNLSLIALRWDDPSPWSAELGSPSDEEINRAIDEIRGIIRGF